MSHDANEAQVHRYRGAELGPPCLRFHSFAEILQAHPDAATFLTFYQRNSRTATYRFGEFRGLVYQCAIRLAAMGVQSGDRVGLLLGNSVETYVAYAALLLLSAVLVPVDPNESPNYIGEVLRHAEVKLTLALPIHLAKAPSGAVEFTSDEFFREPAASYQTLTRESLGAPAAMFYTSGTTGAPKGVLLSRGNLFANIEGTIQAGDFTSRSVLMTCLPLYHVNAFNFAFLLPFFTGARIVYQSGFTTEGFWRIADDEGVRVLSLVPPVIQRLLQSHERPGGQSVQRVISAASALPRDVLVAFLEQFGIPIHQAYGLSETVNFTLFTPFALSREHYIQALVETPIPSAGQAVLGNEIVVLNEHDQPITEEGAIGQFGVRGWNVFQQYFKNPKATEQAFANGYFHTGDTGYFRDLSGGRFFYITGRSKEIIKRNGETIYLVEVDTALRNLGMRQGCAVGFENKNTGEEIGLYLSHTDPLSGQSDRDLLASVQSVLSFAKSPKVVIRGAEVPLTSVGKIKRLQLKSLFAPYGETRFGRSNT